MKETLIFQSTLPYGSDLVLRAFMVAVNISIHAPLRERPFGGSANIVSTGISIHAPLRERPFGGSANIVSTGISIHAPLRERHAHVNGPSVVCIFQSTLPYGSDRSL